MRCWFAINQVDIDYESMGSSQRKWSSSLAYLHGWFPASVTRLCWEHKVKGLVDDDLPRVVDCDASKFEVVACVTSDIRDHPNTFFGSTMCHNKSVSE